MEWWNLTGTLSTRLSWKVILYLLKTTVITDESVALAYMLLNNCVFRRAVPIPHRFFKCRLISQYFFILWGRLHIGGPVAIEIFLNRRLSWGMAASMYFFTLRRLSVPLSGLAHLAFARFHRLPVRAWQTKTNKNKAFFNKKKLNNKTLFEK